MSREYEEILQTLLELRLPDIVTQTKQAVDRISKAGHEPRGEVCDKIALFTQHFLSAGKAPDPRAMVCDCPDHRIECLSWALAALIATGRDSQGCVRSPES